MEDKNFDSDEVDFDVKNVEDFKEQDIQFSHQVLVMSCLRKCIEYGTVEMVEGKMEAKRDKLGNMLSIYRQDTRKRFIEAIKTAKNFMRCDFDDKAKRNINILLDRIKDRYRFWDIQESKWWNSLNEAQQRANMDKYTSNGVLNRNNIFYNYYLDDELDIYRRILEQLNLLTKREGFYKSEKSGA